MKTTLDMAALLAEGAYSWEKHETEDLYVLRRVIFCTRPASNTYQSMNIFVPAAYFNSEGSIDPAACVNGYTPSTAPVVFRNNCSGWMSSDPDMDRGAFTVKDCAQSGYIYVSCGARSRDLGRLGKMPAPVVDLKAGIRFLRLNSGVLPGCMDRIISIGDLVMDCDARRVQVAGHEVNLTAKEFDVLELLVMNPNKVYSRESLLSLVWGADYPGDVRTVDVHIRRLREKIEDNPSTPKYVHTKWGVGYYFQH